MMKRFVLVLLLTLAAVPARADIYVRPTWDNLLKTLVRYGALELDDDKILDEYALVTDCDIYKAFSHNDFKWHQVQQSIRDSVKLNMTKFPVSYAYEGKIALDHYDFQQQIYQFSDKNPLQKVNAFFLYRTDGVVCGDHRVRSLPLAFRAVLDEPVTLPGLPLTQRSADDLLRRMDANKNRDRLIYVRFNLHINFIGKLGRNPDPNNPAYVQNGARSDSPVLLNAQIDTIDFFEDELHQKLLYSYQL